jgi:hypothetical protein
LPAALECCDDRAVRDTAQWYLEFARQTFHESPVYAAWASAVATDGEALALIETLPEQKRQPPLVFAVARICGAVDEPDGLPDFLREAWPQLGAEILRRPMQTNEPGRCTALLPALARLPGPLALLELGASAGLCLYPDRFSYDFAGARIDPADGPSGVLLECSVSGMDIPERMPEVVWRAGIDLEPLRVDDPLDRAWLEALVWPGQARRLSRVRAAIEIARADAPLLLRGNARERLVAAAARAPAGATLVIVTAGVLVYIPFLERELLVADIRRLGARWVSLEGAAVLPEVRRRLPQGEEEGRFVVALDEQPLAFAGPHGESLAGIYASGA